jgi:hypothetical protein
MEVSIGRRPVPEALRADVPHRFAIIKDGDGRHKAGRRDVGKS